MKYLEDNIKNIEDKLEERVIEMPFWAVIAASVIYVSILVLILSNVREIMNFTAAIIPF